VHDREPIDRVRTARLVGCRPAFRDADELHEVLGDERVAAWLWPGELGGPRSLSQVRALLVRDGDHWKRRGWGPWVVRDAATNTVVGRVGLRATDTDEVEVLWAVASARWGEGLAAEMATEAVRVGFDVLGLDALVSFTLHENAASRRVMDKLGFAYEKTAPYKVYGPHVLYRLRRA
jgi:[ribosomal protein S5]-alanine N-acetyltransferase